MPTRAEPSLALVRRLIALAVLAAWSITPPYVGPALGLRLDVASSLEVIDHVLPGVACLLAACIATFRARRGATDDTFTLALLGVIVLASLFQTVSHVPLVLDVGSPVAPAGAVALHASPGPVLLALSLWLLLRPVPEAALP